MSRKRESADHDEDNGFGAWGGYMEAKKTKLLEQYKTEVSKSTQLSAIFKGVSILVNGLTKPPADDLKKIMSEHGGTFHLYQSSKTTHIIASNLPNVKINKLGSVPIVKPTWITDSLSQGRLLDYRPFLLYTNQNSVQPRLDFAPIAKTASDPKFLEEFYNNSRLHLIATMGTEFKQLIQDLRQKNDGTFPGREKLPRGNGSNAQIGTIVMHIDMDCFFVSVGLRNRPELRGLPVAVTHARNGQLNRSKERELDVLMNLDRLAEHYQLENLDGKSSMSEIASCSYEARKCGVKNGMFLGAAVKLCPNIQTIPYDFEDYKSVSTTLYHTMASYTLDIEAVSCDEMYVDVTPLLQLTDWSVAQWSAHIRTEITEATGCPCSTGFGANRLQARLATRRAKPNGSFHLRPEMVEQYVRAIPLRDLPGVGDVTVRKLRSLGANTCADVIDTMTLQRLQSELGTKTGECVHEQCRGIDTRPLCYQYERKSVSAEVNYGIRFRNMEETYKFLDGLSSEVWQRLAETKLTARAVTLKLMVRSKDAPVETAKYLGHGLCDNLSKSTTLNFPLPDAQSVYREVRNLYDKYKVDFAELRGIGIQLSKLERHTHLYRALDSFLTNRDKTKTDVQVVNIKKSPIKSPVKSTRGPARKTLVAGTKSVKDFFKETKDGARSQEKLGDSRIDLNVLKELPTDLQDEIIQEYNLDVESTTRALPIGTTEPAVVTIAGNPFSGLQWCQLRTALREWMTREQRPKPRDIQLLAEHLKQLAIDRQIELLKIVCNFLHRHLEQQDCAWHRAYFDIVDRMQLGMVARYGCTLLITRQFNCCQP